MCFFIHVRVLLFGPGRALLKLRLHGSILSMLLGSLAYLVMIGVEHRLNQVSAADRALLSTLSERAPVPRNESSQLAQERRSRRIERANARERGKARVMLTG